MKTPMNTLLSDAIAVGHCVIVNEYDRPSAHLLAVITSIGNDIVNCKYLNAEERLNRFNYGDGLKSSRVTPIAQFGVSVCWKEREERDGKIIIYWCEPTGNDSTATYVDGKIRQWQESSIYLYVARPDVFRVAANANRILSRKEQ